jgi:very-short-patch-repair endonuclease
MSQTQWTPPTSYIESRFLQFWSRLKIPYQLEAQYPVCGFYLDYAHVEARIAVELDGSYHDTPEQQERDAWRQSLIEAEGWSFVRISGKQMLHDPVRSAYRVKRAIEQSLAARGA